MHHILIRRANILTPFRRLDSADLLVQNGRIAAVGRDLPFAGTKVIDARGDYLVPGFIDLHIHGGGGHDFMDGKPEAFAAAAMTHMHFGTTCLLPTSLASDDDELPGLFQAFQTVRKAGLLMPDMPGLHLEGPYFSMEQRGAQDPRFIRHPDPDHYRPILARWGHLVKRWSAAPELPGAGLFASDLKQAGILPSIAHSDASYEEVEAAYEAGFCHMTHLYSGMSGLRRVNGLRRPGVIESAYILDDMTVEVIADGMHVPPALLRQVYKHIGPQRTALVTDAMRAAGTDHQTSTLGSLTGGQMAEIADGVAWLPDRTAFAGSICTMDRAVRTMVQQTGVPLLDAVRMATVTPARIAGLTGKGILAAGADADLVLLSQDLHVRLTMIDGKIAWQDGHTGPE